MRYFKNVVLSPQYKFIIWLDSMAMPQIVRTYFLNKQISTLNISPSTNKK